MRSNLLSGQKARQVLEEQREHYLQYAPPVCRRSITNFVICMLGLRVDDSLQF